MKHCHFSILYNELPFLKQKLPFLYKNFDQIIFYDLSAFDGKFQFSTDGGHEYIKNYPDPENKITLIELRHGIQFVQPMGAATNVTKMKMFSYANKFIKDDIDVFWCTDMDEFFNIDLIKEVEEVLTTKPNIRSIDVDHYLFWKNLNIISCESIEKLYYNIGLIRIARHAKGNKYGHCDIGQKYKPSFLTKSKIYHFENVGENRTFAKLFKYYDGTRRNYKETWEQYSNIKLEKNKLYGYPDMHPNADIKVGIMFYPGDLQKELSYFNFKEAAKDLNCKY